MVHMVHRNGAYPQGKKQKRSIVTGTMNPPNYSNGPLMNVAGVRKEGEEG